MDAGILPIWFGPEKQLNLRSRSSAPLISPSWMVDLARFFDAHSRRARRTCTIDEPQQSHNSTTTKSKHRDQEHHSDHTIVVAGRESRIIPHVGLNFRTNVFYLLFLSFNWTFQSISPPILVVQKQRWLDQESRMSRSIHQKKKFFVKRSREGRTRSRKVCRMYFVHQYFGISVSTGFSTWATLGSQ